MVSYSSQGVEINQSSRAIVGWQGWQRFQGGKSSKDGKGGKSGKRGERGHRHDCVFLINRPVNAYK